jgi:hypothetical protein
MQNLEVARSNAAKLATCGAIRAGPKNAGLDVNFAPQSWQRHPKRQDAPDCHLLFGSKPNAVAGLYAVWVSAFWCYASYCADSFHTMPEQRPLTVACHLIDEYSFDDVGLWIGVDNNRLRSEKQ